MKLLPPALPFKNCCEGNNYHKHPKHIPHHSCSTFASAAVTHHCEQINYHQRFGDQQIARNFLTTFLPLLGRVDK